MQLPPDHFSKSVVENVLKSILGKGGSVAKISAEDRQAFHQQFKGLPPQKFLLQMMQRMKIGTRSAPLEDGVVEGINSLSQRFGQNLGDFLQNPRKEDYRASLAGLTEMEKMVITVLNKVGRM